MGFGDSGTPMELYHQPVNLFVAGFIGAPKMNLISGVVTSATSRAAVVLLDGGACLYVPVAGLRVDTKVTVGLRPEYISAAADGPIAGQVELIEHLGSEVIAYVAIGAAMPLTVKFPTDTAVKVGDMVRLEVRADAARVFDESGKVVTMQLDAMTSLEMAP